jgi:hypothetical protein
MSKSQTSVKDDENYEKRIKTPFLQPKATVELAQEHVHEMISKGERVLGMMKEYSGWDVYNNEARKVDNELVKDWTTSLNFLLIFVSSILNIYIKSF